MSVRARYLVVGTPSGSLGAAVAVAHRAHRLAFAMMRTQTLFDPDQWHQSIVDGSVTAADSDRTT